MAQLGRNYSIELLNGNNYYNWKFRIEMILAENGVQECIKKEVKLNEITDEKQKAMMSQKDSKAKSLIVQCVEDSQLECLREKDTAFKMWKTLQDRYEKKGLPGQLYLKKKLLSLKMKEGDSLEKFITEFEEVVRQLRGAGAEVNDQDLVCNILLSLPKSYETVITVIENMQNISYEEVKNKLFAENEKRKMSEQKENRSSQEKVYALALQKGNCFRCGEVGHFKKDCKAILNESRPWRCASRGRGDFRRSERGRLGADRGGRGSRYVHRNSHRSNFAENDQDCEVDKSVCFMGQVENVLDKSEGSYIKFFIDSGCTDHMVNKKCYFTDLLTLKDPIKIAVAKENHFLLATGVGNIIAFSKIGKEKIKCTIKNVFYVPELRKNLLSVKRLVKSDIMVNFEKDKVKIIDKDKRLVGVGLGRENSLYEISFEYLVTECLNVEHSGNNEFLKWHRRYGHIGFSNLEKLIKQNVVTGFEKNIKIQHVEFCESCTNGKMTRLPFSMRTKSKRILEIIHSDVCGPITPETFEGNRYFVTFIDDFSDFTVVYLIKHKSQVFEKFCEFVAVAESKFNCKISVLRSDNGGEYSSKEFDTFCKNRGIIQDFTVSYTPQQNGKAERKNRSLVERSRAMLDDSGLPKGFWGEAIRTANYVMNRSITANTEGTTPAEIWYKVKPDVRNMRIFGCTAYNHIPGELRKKFDAKAKKCIMVGYAPTGYRLWDIEEKKIIICRDVEFDENRFHFKRKEIQINIDEKEGKINKEISERSELEENNETVEQKGDECENKMENENRNSEVLQKRRVKQPLKYQDYEIYMAFDATAFVENVPNCYDELNGRKDKVDWLNAVNKELRSIDKNKTWEKVDRPENVNILDTKWVFTYKPLEGEREDKYKARLVVRGFAQEKDKHYDDIYSPVAKMTTIRALLIVGNQLKYDFQQLDVKTAFLNSILDEDIYIFAPEGIKCENNKVFKLKKSLYGLKQSPKCWNDEINKFLLEIGFTRSENDFCLYILNFESEKLFLLIYVDDIIIAGRNLTNINLIKQKLMNKFQMKDKGHLKNFLGLEIEYNREVGIMRIHQSKYAESILKRFHMENCKAISTPIDPKLNLDLCNDPSKVTKKPFRELVGCLMYLMLGTRPDICFPVNFFSRFQDKATDECWNFLKRILRYLKNTVNYGLEFKRSNNMKMCCYVDADWGSDTLDRKSISGFVFKIFGNTLMWRTKKQNSVSLSTTEAELVALCHAVCEGLWIKKLLCDFNVNFSNIEFYEDNQGCISLIKNPANNRRVKHVDLKYNFVCENYKNGIILLFYIDTSNQQADLFTKGLVNNMFSKFRGCLGLKDFSEGECCKER